MTEHSSKAPMLELYVFETNQLLDQLEQIIIDGEKNDGLAAAIDEVFRMMHTIKGSSAMMLFNNIATLSHSVEDVFYYLRESKVRNVDYSQLTDLVLNAVDFIKGEVGRVGNGENPCGDCSELIKDILAFLSVMKASGPLLEGVAEPVPAEQKYYIGARKQGDNSPKISYEVRLFFEEGCEMEHIRAFGVVHEINEFAEVIRYSPENILEDDNAAECIRQDGFVITMATAKPADEVKDFFAQTMFLRDFHINCISGDKPSGQKEKKVIDLEGPLPDVTAATNPSVDKAETQSVASLKQNLISVNVAKMDILMDLVGELVIAEAMVTHNPELKGLTLDKFYKATRQLRKITNELQDIVMSVRMVSLSTTFQKMNRIIRDMNKRLNKQTELEIIGEATEVDKNIIEQISDPLMHLIRNAVDHGIEPADERIAKGKSSVGKIRLEAKNAGGDVWITVQDDGGGLNKEKILNKARERGLLQKSEEALSDKEIFSFILHPGFSTKDNVTEFSGRGVGMDVVAKNIEKIGGAVSVDSNPGEGTKILIRIPLTLAIVDGMIVRVGGAVYTIPIIAIKESFQVKDHNLIKDTENNEMIMIRGECFSVIRLHERFQAKTTVTDFSEGIMVMVEDNGKSVCLFADSLLGQQQVVVKALPSYIKKTEGITGCTLLGDGNVSLILDVAGLVHN
jgi:two-component system chemotaxis sensor kinase CheA